MICTGYPRFPINKRSRFKHGLARLFPLPARVYRKLRREGFKATAAAVWRRLKGKPRPKG